MKELTKPEIEMGFKIWRSRQRDFKLDEELPTRGFRGSAWLGNSRKALRLSGVSVASKLRISPAGYCKLEESEATGTISITSLGRAAEAMDCELVYFIRPKSGHKFSEVIWQKVFTQVKDHGWLAHCDQRRRGWALASLAERKMLEPKFRRDQGWTRTVSANFK